MNKTEFSTIMKEARESRQITISELARTTGFSRQAIYKWEAGERNISLKNADKLLGALGVSFTIGSRA